MPQRHVLIVAQEIELRARIARVVQSAGHVVELAGSRTRALELAASKKIEAAIVVHSSNLSGLGQDFPHGFAQRVLGRSPANLLLTDQPGGDLKGGGHADRRPTSVEAILQRPVEVEAAAHAYGRHFAAVFQTSLDWVAGETLTGLERVIH